MRARCFFVSKHDPKKIKEVRCIPVRSANTASYFYPSGEELFFAIRRASMGLEGIFACRLDINSSNRRSEDHILQVRKIEVHSPKNEPVAHSWDAEYVNTADISRPPFHFNQALKRRSVPLHRKKRSTQRNQMRGCAGKMRGTSFPHPPARARARYFILSSVIFSATFQLFASLSEKSKELKRHCCTYV
jgi:hypothetical protein